MKCRSADCRQQAVAPVRTAALLPHRTQPFTPTGFALPAPICELELKPGDLLYLPRGYVHAASTSRSHSAHVTIGMTVYTWVELLSELVTSAKDIAGFRAALPPGFATRDDLKKTLKDGLLRCVDQLRNDTDGDRLIDGFLTKVRSGRERPPALFASEVRVIGLRTQLKTPESGRYRISMEPHGTILEFEGRKFVLPEKSGQPSTRCAGEYRSGRAACRPSRQ